jgi:hypothetical protein
MVRMMTANLQDALNVEGSLKIDTDGAGGQLQAMANDGYIDFDSSMIQGDIDYLVIDGTLPVEPARNAETWMNMLQVMGQTGLNMEYNTGKILEEAIRAMGVSDIEQYKVSQEQMQQQGPSPSQQMAMAEKARGASVVSQEQLMEQAQKGNVVPMREAQ